MSANGDTVWTRTYGGSGIEEARAVQQTADNGYIIAGHTTSYGSGGRDFYLIKAGPTGSLLWEQTYGGSGNDFCESVDQGLSGGYILTGFTQSFGAGAEDFWGVRTDENGDTLWMQTYGGEQYDRCREVQQTSDGGYVFAGETRSFGAGQRDAYLVKTEPEGPPLPVPSAPYIVEVRKNLSDIYLTWNQVTTDTSGNPDTIDHYVIYRDTNPNYIVSTADSIGYRYYPETTYIDLNALYNLNHFYYLVKAVNIHNKKSPKSNMAYKLSKFFNENPTTTDKNWTSLPWYNDYATVSDLTDDLSPHGDPLPKATRLRDDQFYESWMWDEDFGEWYGANYAIDSGRAYSLVTNKDTSLFLVGSNNPNGLVWLNENPTTTDKNWVSIPYNAVYNTVSEIADEYSPTGNPLTKLTNNRNSQFFESWLWDSIMVEWYGANFNIEPGRGYEFVTIVDTTWNPTEYSNEPSKGFGDRVPERPERIVTHLGTASTTDRAPIWSSENLSILSDEVQSSQAEAEHNSHILRCYIRVSDDIVFTAYRPSQPHDALSEDMIGCGIAQRDDIVAIWLDCGNFKAPWQDGEEVILIVEALRNGEAHCNVMSFKLDQTINIQDIGTVDLISIHDLIQKNENVMGFSIYDDEVRLNNNIMAVSEIRDHGDADIRPVIHGGYETVYSSQGRQSRPDKDMPLVYAFTVAPNPFMKDVHIEYAIPHQAHVEISIYDVSGRRVRTLGATVAQPGYYTAHWDGSNHNGRQVSSGVYMLRFKTDDFTSTKKLVLLR